MKILLPVFYLPPISWFSKFFKEDAEVVFEVSENFPKQTYRNRTVIYGANGKLSLIIPISHTGERVISKTQVCNRENWQKLHWKSIKTAYQTSPYFEFYEDKLTEIFTFETTSLLAFNLNALSIIQKILKTDKTFTCSESYQSHPEAEDFRTWFSAKTETTQEFEVYFQSFQAKAGFLPDLSIIDLICNKGPEALTYIKNQ